MMHLDVVAGIVAKCAKHQLTIQFDHATLQPEFHFVSLIITTSKGVQLAWCSKSFTNFDRCYAYIENNLDELIKAIPSIEKEVETNAKQNKPN